MTAACSSSFASIPGYEFFRGDALGDVRKHGTALYVKCTLRSVQVNVSLPNVVAVHLVDLGLYVVSIYRPPSMSNEENETLVEFLGSFTVGKETVILGDFNLPTVAWSHGGYSGQEYVRPVDRMFCDCFVECGLKQWVDFGTFFPSGNTLDLILTSEDDRVIDVFALSPLPGCHHSPVVCRLVFQFGVIDSLDGDRSSLSWGRGDYVGMSEELAHIDWETLFYDLDVNQSFNIFRDILVNY